MMLTAIPRMLPLRAAVVGAQRRTQQAQRPALEPRRPAAHKQAVGGPEQGGVSAVPQTSARTAKQSGSTGPTPGRPGCGA